VAWRALDPRLPIKPGMVRYRPRLDEGPARDAFSTWSSLLPGTLPAGPDGRGGIFVHCLDAQTPVTARLAEEEQRFTEALKGRA
jgi:multicomponent Na+:H+ antiporter subunit E